jgi:porin
MLVAVPQRLPTPPAVCRETKRAGTVRPFLVLLAGLLIAAAQAKAQTPAPEPSLDGDFWNRPKLTGSWGGWRDDWAAHGVTLDLDATETLQGVISGGIPQTGTTAGSTLSSEALLSVDTGKAGLWQGGFLKLRIEDRTGESALARAGTVSPVYAQSLFPAAPGDANKDVFGLTELNYTQFFSPQFAVLGGLLNTLDGDDNPIAGNFRRNETFLNGAMLASLVALSSTPSVTLGGGALWLPTPTVAGAFLVYNSQESATLDPFAHGQGTTFATSWTVKHTLWDRPGGQLFGAVYAIDKSQTDIAADPRVFIANLITAGTVPSTTKDTWALYYNAYQYVSGNEQRGWGPFLRAGISDGNPNPIKYDVSVGLGGKGTFFDRDNDRWGVGYYHLGMSDAGLLAGLHIGDEDGAEAFYNLAITPALHLTFDTQLVSSARPRQQTAGIFATRLRADF